MMLLKIIIAIVLLFTPPWGWVALFVWAVVASGGAKSKEGGSSSSSSSSEAPRPAAPSVPEKPAFEPMVVKVESGFCNVYLAKSGAFVRNFGPNVVQASISGDYVAVVYQNGQAEIRCASNGAYLRSYGPDVVNAQMMGDNVSVTFKNGRVDLYCAATGAYIRSL